jgi:hypothetical protein
MERHIKGTNPTNRSVFSAPFLSVYIRRIARFLVSPYTRLSDGANIVRYGESQGLMVT